MNPTDLDVPQHAFRPDEWTDAFQAGLANSCLAGKTVYEVGVGTGINIPFLVERCSVGHVFGSDIDKRLPPLAAANVHRSLDGQESRFTAIAGLTDLLNIQPDEVGRRILETVHVVAACIPQAFLPEGTPPSPDDRAHYYPRALFEHLPGNKFALGLNEALLVDARRRCPRAEVILNLAGRVGFTRLRRLFTSNGFRPEVVHEATIPQCPTTNLGYFVDLERIFAAVGGIDGEPFSCEFFDEDERQLCAAEAEERRVRGMPVFHKIYVVKGIPVI